MTSILNRAALALTVTASIMAFSACRTLPKDTVLTSPSAPASPVEVAEVASDSPAAILAEGAFEGRNDHIVTGKVSILESNGKYTIQLADDFSLDNAPDPKVGLGKDGYDAATQAGNLIALTGASSYEVPASINVQDYNEVYIWCEKFDVPLGIAALQTQ